MRLHRERHKIGNIGWLRAAVLGANDGIVSTSSLILGVAAAHGTHNSILVAGVAGLASGAMSMAAGEYVSVSSQADTEKSALELEKSELKNDPAGELKELVGIYVKRGLDVPLAKQVAEQLMAHDALGAHARDELGINEDLAARPIQAALASAASFATGAALPLLAVAFTPPSALMPTTVFSALIFLIMLGAVSAKIGGSSVRKSVFRVTIWSALAMAVTHFIGTIFGTIT
jgi:VIT1/CCC1 family predicted Fe2+/Mn2+ transporter